MKLSFFSVLLLAGHLCAAAPMPLPESNDGARHVFSTNQENFLMDGKPVKIISGEMHYPCLLYTSDAADERINVDIRGLRIWQKNKHY